MGIPGAAPAMRIVVLTAILSCMNSSLYITSRVMAELASYGDAPAMLRRRGGQKAPVNAIIANSLAGVLVAFSSILAPGTVFAFLLSCSGGVMLLVYSLIVTAYVVMRKRTPPGERARLFSIPFFPALNFLTLAGVVIIFVVMLMDLRSAWCTCQSGHVAFLCAGLCGKAAGYCMVMAWFHNRADCGVIIPQRDWS